MAKTLTAGKSGTLNLIKDGVVYKVYPNTYASNVVYDTTSGQTVDEAIASILTDVESLQKSVSGLTGDLGDYILESSKGVADGVAPLNSSAKIDATYLPSFVDDVIEGTMSEDLTTFTAKDDATGETVTYTSDNAESGKIYADTTTNKTYRWGGTAFVMIGSDLALGETSETAYRGDYGKVAYDHSQITSGNPHNVTAEEIGLGNVENKSAATILGELTKQQVIDLIGYTPADDASATTVYVQTDQPTDTNCIWFETE